MKSILVRSISSIIVGGLLVAFHNQAAVWLIVLIGCLFLGPGIYSMITFWTLRNTEGYRPVFPIVGLGSVILGLWMIFNPSFFARSIMFALGGLLVVAAIGQLAAVIRARKVAPAPFLFYAIPVFLLLAGIFVITNLDEAVALPFYIVGISMVVYGIVEMIHYFWLQKQLKDLERLNNIEDAEIVSEEKDEPRLEDNSTIVFSVLLALALGFNSCAEKSADTGSAPTVAEQETVMTFDQIISGRYACRSYDSERQLSEEQLNTILEAGRKAPTAKNLQEQHVYVLQSPEALAKLDSISPCRYGAPTCLVVTYDSNNVFTYPGGKYHSGVEDATIVATHMILAAQNVGVNSCWVNIFDPDQMAKAFSFPEGQVPVMIMDLGFGSKDAAPNPNHFNRKPLSETVTFL